MPCPRELSAGAAFAQVILANQGVLYLDHGWQTIVESIQRKLNPHSTSLRFGAHVQSVKQLADAVEIVVDEDRFYLMPHYYAFPLRRLRNFFYRIHSVGKPYLPVVPPAWMCV